jgi:hypothetical protein
MTALIGYGKKVISVLILSAFNLVVSIIWNEFQLCELNLSNR